MNTLFNRGTKLTSVQVQTQIKPAILGNTGF